MSGESKEKSNDKTYSLFLGCVIPNRYPTVEKGSRVALDALGVKLIEMDGASCCPAPGVFRGVDDIVWNLIGARNISIAEENGADLVTLCNGCYGTLAEVDHNMKHKPNLRKEINSQLKEIGREYKGSVAVKQIMEVLYKDLGLEFLKSKMKYDLGLNIGVHYGCHLLKPANIRPFDDQWENPRFFDEVVEVTGCKSVDYDQKMMCCGAGGGLRSSFKEESIKFTREKLRSMRDAGCDAIVVCCPFCELQLDIGQAEVNGGLLDEGEEKFDLPVIFITQLLGLSMGIDPKELGLLKDPEIKGVLPMIATDGVVKKVMKNIEKQKNEEAN